LKTPTTAVDKKPSRNQEQTKIAKNFTPSDGAGFVEPPMNAFLAPDKTDFTD
jgi:hypothetical protein